LKRGNFRLNKAWVLQRILLAVIVVAFSLRASAQPEMQKPARILFLLDASSSMLNDWTPAENRFKTAARIISSIVDSIHQVNSDVAFAVRVFGSQYPSQEKNCYDSRLEVSFNTANVNQIRARLKYLNPMGYSPIAWSLKETAENDFVESNRYAYSIILITDGGESCGGDICATVTNLLAKKISFKPYILSLVDYQPLKEQYDCLGKYLTVAKEKDIEPAIRTIINDNRKILSIRTSELKSVPATVVRPSATPVKPLPQPVIKKEEPVIVKKEEPKPPVIVKQEPPVQVAEEPLPVLPKTTPIERIRSRTKLSRMNMLYTLADAVPVKVPRLPRMKILKVEEEPPAIAVNTPAVKAPRPAIVEPTVDSRPAKPAVNTKPVTPPRKEVEKLDFVLETQEAKESTLQVYFTNGQGRYYPSEPKLVIMDSKTNKEVKSVFRNVTGGVPEPIKMPVGIYDIIIPGSKAKATNVVITAGNNSKVTIKVGRGALAFHYPTAPNRPVKEYTALVSKRFEQGPVVKHKCDEELPYDPTNYHVEINTLPPLVYNIDVDFNNVKMLEIPEPGTIQITNMDNTGKVQFWQQLGDSFVPFFEMMVAGNPDVQKANFRPGLYQVRYFKKPNMPYQKAEVIQFRIKSNMTTKVELVKD
jgi:hypothetical protein